jgi:tetratricopeptide (TPR) repeat protein
VGEKPKQNSTELNGQPEILSDSNDRGISPKSFLKQSRPGKFSDSVKKESISLSRPVLENHLLILSKRNEQDIFEKFAVRLCEVEISPNLKPNTGPAGGGDGKTDAESYPVSKDTAMGWYIGYETAGSDQKLAFAISAKKAWEAKLRQDMEKIHKTGGKFTRVYFVTNQYVKADKRKALEKELSAQYSTEVHVFDLTWILAKIYDNNRLELAVKELGLEVDSPTVIDVGPQDTARQKRIQRLESSIENNISKATVDYTTVRDCIDVAVLSREQELPRAEVEGRLDRAIRLADRNGTVNQRFMARYQKCWTAFWYFEDFQSLKDWYDDAEAHALTAGGINNLEKLSNLYQILMTAYDRDKAIVSKAFLASKSQTLTSELQKIASNPEAPSSALFARALLAQIAMSLAIRSGQSLNDSLGEFENIITESEGSPGFPFESISEILTILGGVIGDSDKYDALFAQLREITRKREGEKRSAEMVLGRSKVLLENEKYYKAIQILGSALPDFYKEETMDEAAEALFLIGTAYEQVGLAWAARGSYINAASIETSRFHSEDELTSIQIGLYKAMVTTELRLGRIPQVLQWYEVFSMMVSILSPDEWNIERLHEHSLMDDLRLGAILLTSDQDAYHIAKAMPILERFGLVNAVVAAEYRSDRTDLWPSEFTDNVKENEREKFFSGWAKQVSSDRAPELLEFYDEENVNLTSHIVGCTVTVHFENSVLNTITAESILSSIEALMATALLHHGIGIEPKLDIYLVNNSSKDTCELTVQLDGDGTSINVTVPDFNPNSLSAENQAVLGKSLLDIATRVMAATVMFKDTQESLEEIMGKEKAFIRSVNFTASYICLGNVVGYQPKYKLSDWAIASDQTVAIGSNPPKPLPRMSAEKDEAQEFNIESISHSQIRTLSVIRLAYWDKANWKGIMYMYAPTSDEPPVMGLLFEDPEMGEKIFKGWQEKYGSVDTDESVRIAIMRDIDNEFPADYRVGISANIKSFVSKGHLVASATRIHTMNPETKINLHNFLKQYKKVGSFRLALAAFNADGKVMVHHYLGLYKNELTIKTPSELTDNDPDKILIGKSRQK